MVDFSQRLKQIRRDKHLTQAQVAARIGVTPSMVSSYETDGVFPIQRIFQKQKTQNHQLSDFENSIYSRFQPAFWINPQN